MTWRACQTCDVRWEGPEQTCWSCGMEGAVVPAPRVMDQRSPGERRESETSWLGRMIAAQAERRAL